MKICLSQCRQLYMPCAAAVPLYIAALKLHCHSAARPIRARTNIIYILYKEIIAATIRIKISAVNIF